MARQIVTQAAVNEAAESLLHEGLEPSLVAVQSRIGGGSYSTVKKCLDIWKQARAEAMTALPDPPPEIQAKGQEFARIVWALAAREAQSKAQQIKDAAHAEVASMRGELAEATTEIARLEGVETAQAATIDRQAVQVRELELALAEAQTQARRVLELEKSLAEIRVELDISRQALTEQAVAAGRQAGEAEALRAQVRELLAAIKPSSGKR